MNEMNDCPNLQNHLLGQLSISRRLLDRHGIRPTRQRLSLAALLFGKGNRHITADELLQEAEESNIRASQATIYNTLKCFADLGLIRCVAIAGQPAIFDTNTSPHHHFLFEDRHQISDVPAADLKVTGLPRPPEGYEIASIDVLVRLKPKNKP